MEGEESKFSPLTFIEQLARCVRSIYGSPIDYLSGCWFTDIGSVWRTGVGRRVFFFFFLVYECTEGADVDAGVVRASPALWLRPLWGDCQPRRSF